MAAPRGTVKPVNVLGDLPPNGTPDWWLLIFAYALIQRQEIYELRGDYIEGRHRLPQGEKKYMNALNYLVNLTQSNYCGLITNATTQRMNVRGFEFGDGDGLDPDAAKIWQNSDMDYQSMLIIQAAAKYGISYGLVSPPDELSNGSPVLTFEDPRMTIVYRDPLRPTRIRAAYKMWQDDLSNHIMGLLLLEDFVYLYQGPIVSTINNLTIEGMIQKLLLTRGGQAAMFDLIDISPNPFNGMIPMVEFVWRPGQSVLPEGEIDMSARIIQNRINATILDRLVISRSQAYKQRWVKGINIANSNKRGRDGEGNPDPPFRPGSDHLWFTNSPDAEFGEFQQADLTQLLEAVKDDVAAMAAQTQTPAHYLLGIGNPNGQQFAQEEAALVKKVEQRQKSMSWSFEQMMRLALNYTGNAKAKEPDVTVHWDNPEQNSITDIGAAMAQMTAAGVPLQVNMEAAGIFTTPQIDYAVAEQEKQRAQQLQLQKQQMSNQLTAAKASAQASTSGQQAQMNQTSTGTSKNAANQPKGQGAQPAKAKAAGDSKAASKPDGGKPVVSKPGSPARKAPAPRGN